MSISRGDVKTTTVINQVKLFSIEVTILLVAFLSSALLIFYLVKEVFYSDAVELDKYVFDFFANHTTPGLTSFMKRVTILGGHQFLVPANLSIIAYSYFIRRKKWFAIKTFAVAFSSLILMFALKAMFNRSRPLTPLLGEVAGLSFPSGHAFMSFTFFGLLIYVVYQQVENIALRWTLIILLLATTFVVGISRIYLRVHYPTDVLAGFSIGTMWLILSMWILHLIEKNKTKLPAI